MMKQVKIFFDQHNLRPFESIWLLYVHVFGIIGLICAFMNIQLIGKIFLTACILHNIGALGITAGSHRLWSHKAYQASFIWRFIIMLFNSSNFYLII
jgi:stearoyl-CoA desaturase (delta-9 desaturase)